MPFSLPRGLMQCMLHCEAAQNEATWRWEKLPSFKPSSSNPENRNPSRFSRKKHVSWPWFFTGAIGEGNPIFLVKEISFLWTVEPRDAIVDFFLPCRMWTPFFWCSLVLGEMIQFDLTICIIFQLGWNSQLDDSWVFHFSIYLELLASYRHCFAMPFTPEYLKPPNQKGNKASTTSWSLTSHFRNRGTVNV